MASWLKQSVAADIMLGPFVDSTDGFTPETALTITQPDIRLSKNGGAFAQKSAAQTLTHGENGWYPCNLSTTDTNTLGLLTVAVYESGALPVWREFMVVTAQVYDSYLSTDVLQVDVAQWLGTAAATPTVAGVPEVDATHWRGSALAAGIAGVPLVEVAYWLGSLVATPTVAGVPEVDTTHYLGTAAPALVGGRYDASVGAMAANVITAAATATDFSTEVNTAVLAVLGALADAAADGDPTSADTLMMYVKQLVNTLVGTAGIPTFPTSAVPANAVSLAESIRQIYDEVAGVNGITPPAASAVTTLQTDVDDIQARLPAALVSGRMDSSVGAMAANVMTAAAAAADLTTELQAGLATSAALATVQSDTDNIQTRLPTALVSGRMDSLVGAMANDVLTAAATAADFSTETNASVLAAMPAAAPTAAVVADAVWDEAIAGHLAAGSTGEALTDAAAGGGGGGTDPWLTPVPGAYAAGTAGNILGNLVNSVWAVSLASITGAAARSPLNALRFLRNKWQVDGTTLTVTQEDDATTAWTATVTSDATAAPVVGNDPT